MSTRHCSEFPHWGGEILLPESFSSPPDPNPQSHAGLCLSSDFPPFPPSLTSSRKFLPGNKNLNILFYTHSLSQALCPHHVLGLFYYYYYYYLTLSTVTSMWPVWGSHRGLMEIKVVPSRKFQAVCFCFLWSH